MKNLKVLQFLFLFFFISIVNGQTLTKEIIEDGNRRKSFHYNYTGKTKVQYLEFEEFVIRIEGNLIQFLDENLEEVDRLKLPEPYKNCHYSIDKNKDHLYITQTEQTSYDKIKSLTLYQIDLFDFNNYTIFTDYPDAPFNESKVLAIDGKLFFMFINKNEN